jgi:hypothetical protein
VLVGHRERHLGGAPGAGYDGPPPDADDPLGAALAEGRDERRTVDEVEAREPIELLVGEPPLRPEEAEVDGAGAQASEVLEEALTIVGADRPDVDGAPVAEELLGRVRTRIEGANGPPAWSAPRSPSPPASRFLRARA